MKLQVIGCVVFIAATTTIDRAQQPEPLRLVQTIRLPVVSKFDHMAVDPGNNRAFVTASTCGIVHISMRPILLKRKVLKPFTLDRTL